VRDRVFPHPFTHWVTLVRDQGHRLVRVIDTRGFLVGRRGSGSVKVILLFQSPPVDREGAQLVGEPRPGLFGAPHAKCSDPVVYRLGGLAGEPGASSGVRCAQVLGRLPGFSRRASPPCRTAEMLPTP
jgi:hypothetical protein